MTDNNKQPDAAPLIQSTGSLSPETLAMYHGYKHLCKIEKLANDQGILEIAELAHYGAMVLGITVGIDVIDSIENTKNMNIDEKLLIITPSPRQKNGGQQVGVTD